MCGCMCKQLRACGCIETAMQQGVVLTPRTHLAAAAVEDVCEDSGVHTQPPAEREGLAHSGHGGTHHQRVALRVRLSSLGVVEMGV